MHEVCNLNELKLVLDYLCRTLQNDAEDVLKILEKQAYSASTTSEPSTSSSQTPPTSSSPTATSATPAEDQASASSKSPPGHIIVPLRGYKRAMVKSMVQAGSIPHFHLGDELDMRAVLALRKAVKEDSVLRGVHLTFLPIMIKVRLAPILSNLAFLPIMIKVTLDPFLPSWPSCPS